METTIGDWILEYTFDSCKWYQIKPFQEETHAQRALRRLRHVSANKSKTFRLRNSKTGETKDK